MRVLYWLLLSGCWLTRTATGQSGDSLRSHLFRAEVGGYAVSQTTMPFWFRANQSGTVPLTGSIGTLRLGARSEYRSPTTGPTRRFDWGYGVDAVANAGAVQQLVLAEAYVKVRYRAIELYVGRRRGIAGLVDTTLTSGAYSWSGNALPMPKIQIGTVGYAPLGFTRGLIAINAFFNHGWFNTGFVEHSYLHQKVLYLRLGKPHWRVHFYGGGNHEVQWGGYAPKLVGVPGLSDKLDGRFGSDLSSYVRVVSTRRGTGYIPPQGVISIDEGNRVGNHLGSLDVGMDLTVGTWRVLAYRQNLYETGSLFYLTNLADGLNGLSLQRLRPGTGKFAVDRLLVEFLYSKSQGGSEFVIDDPKRRGRNNYFNHSQYQDGWTYLGRTIGTPFFTQGSESRPGLASGAIVNNRVALLHLAASGSIAQRVQWLAKLSFSQNLGTYDHPLPAGTNQFSGILNLSAPVALPGLGSCRLNTSVAVDQGQLLTNTTGVFVGLQKTISSRPVTAGSSPY